MQSNSSAKICLVTVTYGDRAEVCLETISRAMRDYPFAAVVVVDNGATPESSMKLRELESRDESVNIIQNRRNYGSAPAFAAGIQGAARLGVDFIMLLDDDNWIAQGSIGNALALLGDRERCCVSLYRSTNWRQRELVARGNQVRQPPGAFLGFDVMSYFVPDWRAGSWSFRRTRSRGGPPLLECAPYGGLIFPISVVDEVGPPLAELVLYEDDIEWTRRIVAAGYELLLAPEATIQDAVEKWTEEGLASGPKRLLSGEDSSRLYYAARNRVYWESLNLGWLARRRHELNRMIYSLVVLLAWRVGSPHARRVWRTAVSDGWNGRLGESYQLPSGS